MNSPQNPSTDQPVWWPVAVALTLVGFVFVAGSVWTFREQTRLGHETGFTWPWLLPLSLDLFAVAMAAVAWAASLDGRAAVLARCGVAFGLAATAASSGAWASLRSDGDPLTVALAVGVPVLALLALEVLLAEVRRQVQRRRGMPRPVAVPPLRLVALLLAPWSTFTTWRRETLTRLRDTQHDLSVAGGGRELSTPDDSNPATPAPAARSSVPAPAGRSSVRRRTSTRPSAKARVATAIEQNPHATAAEIAARLGLSERTVQRYRPKPAPAGDSNPTVTASSVDSGHRDDSDSGGGPVPDLFASNGYRLGDGRMPVLTAPLARK